jgi:hypothetical protein
MSLFKAVVGTNGADKVAARIIAEAEARRSAGDGADFWTEYSQMDIGLRINASTAGVFVARKLAKAGLSVVRSDSQGGWGDSVRLLIRPQ